MHDHPEPSEQEQAATERQQEEEAMRYPGHEDPDAAAEQDTDG